MPTAGAAKLVEFAVAKRCHQRQPEALQWRRSCRVMVHLLGGEPETGHKKNPVQTAGFWDRRGRAVYRARRSRVPGRGTFFDDRAAHEFVIMSDDDGGAARCQPRTVDDVLCGDRKDMATTNRSDISCGEAIRTKKKPGSREPGLRYWPREADTITFQEGLLSSRATGGGGQMRNANAQRANTMIPIGACATVRGRMSVMRRPGAIER